jgi:hypothetical protein
MCQTITTKIPTHTPYISRYSSHELIVSKFAKKKKVAQEFL